MCELLLGLGIALLLSRVTHGRPIITALLAIPAMVSPVMAAMAWRMMFGVKYGAINNLGRQLGLLDVYFDWFSARSSRSCRSSWSRSGTTRRS